GDTSTTHTGQLHQTYCLVGGCVGMLSGVAARVGTGVRRSRPMGEYGHDLATGTRLRVGPARRPRRVGHATDNAASAAAPATAPDDARGLRRPVRAGRRPAGRARPRPPPGLPPRLSTPVRPLVRRGVADSAPS